MLLKHKLVIFILLFFSIVNAQRKPHNFKKEEKNIYIDETEIDVASWLSYYSWILEHEGEVAAEKVLPDSSCVGPVLWSYIKDKSDKKINFCGNYTFQPIGYFKVNCDNADNKSTSNSPLCNLLYYPIRGVSYEQVVQFCKWRTMVEGDGEYIFRLMTEDEWKKYALRGLSEEEQIVGLKDSLSLDCNCVRFDYKSELLNNEALNNTTSGRLFMVASFEYDNNKVYDLFGSVSEMTSEKGIAKGGNYTIYARQCQIDSVQHYFRPEKWLGFRCIGIKLNKENATKLLEENEYRPNN